MTADLPLQTPTRTELNEIARSGPSLSKPPARQMLATLDAGGKLTAAYTVPVGTWQFGPDLTLVALPDEVVVEYVQRLTDAIGAMHLWVAGYCNEVTGYVPSKRISEGRRLRDPRPLLRCGLVRPGRGRRADKCRGRGGPKGGQAGTRGRLSASERRTPRAEPCDAPDPGSQKIRAVAPLRSRRGRDVAIVVRRPEDVQDVTQAALGIEPA